MPRLSGALKEICKHLKHLSMWFVSNEYVNSDVSRASEVSLSIYLRSGSAAQADSFLGGIKFTPDLSTTQAVSDSWYPVVGGSGQVHIKVVFQKATQAAAPLTIEAFELLKVIGKGSFGKVMQVRKRDTSRIYALKTLRKAHIVSRSEVVHTLAERTVLAQVNSPFIVNLKFRYGNFSSFSVADH